MEALPCLALLPCSWPASSPVSLRTQRAGVGWARPGLRGGGRAFNAKPFRFGHTIDGGCEAAEFRRLWNPPGEANHTRRAGAGGREGEAGRRGGVGVWWDRVFGSAGGRVGEWAQARAGARAAASWRPSEACLIGLRCATGSVDDGACGRWVEACNGRWTQCVLCVSKARSVVCLIWRETFLGSASSSRSVRTASTLRQAGRRGRQLRQGGCWLSRRPAAREQCPPSELLIPNTRRSRPRGATPTRSLPMQRACSSAPAPSLARPAPNRNQGCALAFGVAERAARPGQLRPPCECERT